MNESAIAMAALGVLKPAPAPVRNPGNCRNAVASRAWTRRDFTFLPLLGAIALPPAAQAEEEAGKGNNGLLDGIKSMFDPNETTKSGKRLPKAYLKSSREFVKTLRESLEIDQVKERRKFREAADHAKDAIKDWMINWKSSKEVDNEESHGELLNAFRELSTFYFKAGPEAIMPENVKSTILQCLSKAEVDIEPAT